MPVTTVSNTQQTQHTDAAHATDAAQKTGSFKEHTVTKTDTPPRPDSFVEQPSVTKSLKDYDIRQTASPEATSTAPASTPPISTGADGSQTIGDFTIPPVTPEQGKEFAEIAKACGKNAMAFNYRMGGFLTKLLGEKGYSTLANIKEPMYSSTGAPHSKAIASISATQVEHGGKKNLTANHVYMNGHEVGIAMQHPTANDMPAVCEAIFDNNVGTVVDLISKSDRKKHASSPTPPFNWTTLEDMKFGDYTIKHVPQGNPEVVDGYDDIGMFHGQFEITNAQGETKQISVLAYPNWPDGGMVSLGEFNAILEATMDSKADNEGTVMVNCMAGLGRTGTILTGMDIYDSYEDLTQETMEQDILSRVLQGRASRNYDFVQRPQQAQGLIDYAQAILDQLKEE